MPATTHGGPTRIGDGRTKCSVRSKRHAMRMRRGEQASSLYTHGMAWDFSAWKTKSRVWHHICDIAVVSTLLLGTAVPMATLKFLRKVFDDEPRLWEALGSIDAIGTAVVFALFWLTIILRGI